MKKAKELLLDATISIGRFSVVIEDFKIKTGEATFLKGVSGSGKTTILRAIGGIIDSPISEKVTRSFDIVSFVMHETTMLPWCSVSENIKREIKLRDKDFYWERFRKDAIDVGLPKDIEGKKAGSLSQGMRQRVEILKVIAFNSDLILCDEAFSGIDETARISVMIKLDEYLDKTEAALVATSHTEVDILRLADNVILVENKVAKPLSESRTEKRSQRVRMNTSEIMSLALSPTPIPK